MCLYENLNFKLFAFGPHHKKNLCALDPRFGAVFYRSENVVIDLYFRIDSCNKQTNINRNIHFVLETQSGYTLL